MTTQSSTSNDTIQNTTYTVTLEGDEEECILPLSDEILDHLNWQDGDILEWIVNDDNTITLKKFEE
jgi:hypothetical protein